MLAVFTWCHHTKATLQSLVVVVIDIFLNCFGQFYPCVKRPAIVHLTLQDSPESFHRPIVKTMGYSRHALCHALFFKFCMERFVCILKSPVAMKDGMCIGMKSYGLVKGLKDQGIVIVVAKHKCYNAMAIEIKDGTQIKFMQIFTLSILKLRDIGQPFFLWSICMKIAVKNIFCRIFWTRSAACAAVVAPLNSGLEMQSAHQPQYVFIINEIMASASQVITDAAVSLVWMFRVELLYLFRQLLIFPFCRALIAVQPMVISRLRNVQTFTKFIHSKWAVIFVNLSRQCLDGFVFLRPSCKSKASLLSSSSSFFRTAFSICSQWFSRFNLASSSRSFSSGVRLGMVPAR